MKLKKLPSIITDTKFDDNGLAVTEAGLLVPAYVASQLGFSTSGSEQLKRLYDIFRTEAGILPLCPFAACAEYLDFSKLEKAKSLDELTEFWDEFNKLIGPINYGELMPRSKLMIAILDGGHSLDDGVSAEIGYYAATYKGDKPIFAIRSDFRLAENPAALINPAVRYFIDQGPYNGSFFSGPQAYDAAVDVISKFTQQIKQIK